MHKQFSILKSYTKFVTSRIRDISYVRKSVFIRVAKSKFVKPGVFRKKPGVNQEIYDEKPRDKPAVYPIKIIE
jgi:hypothetical protein